nr:ABC transporter substrate-binding protein [Cohnella sp. CFH 77786]
MLALPGNPGKGTGVPVTIEDLTEVLSCTPRNVKLILRKLAEEGFIAWQAGMGRGNSSRMTPLRDLDEVTNEYFRDLLAKDKMKEAMDLISHKDLPVPLRDQLRGLLDERFGFQVERTVSSTVDVLRITINHKFDTLDPAFASTAAEVYVLQQICDKLVAFDTRSKTYLPSLAHTWESDEEGSRWTFYLRKGVRFHHGRTLTSKDVEYTLRRLKDVRSPARWQYEEIDRVETRGDRVISFHLKRPNRMFLHFFGSYYMSILPHDVEFSGTAIVGTGPFRMAEFTDRVMKLEVHGDYFGERAFLDRVELWFTPGHGPNDQYQLPYWEDASPHKNGGSDPSGEIEYRMTGCQFIVFNFRKEGIARNRSFRKAMRLLFDRLAITRDLKGNRNAPADSFMPDRSRLANFQATSLEEAKAHMRDSGYAGQTIKLYFFDNKALHDDAGWLQKRCESIGLRVSLHPVSFIEYYSTEAVREADLMINCEALEDDLEWEYLRLFLDEASYVRRFFDDGQHAWLEEKLRAYVKIPSPEQRIKAMDEIEWRLRDEDWLLFGYHPSKISRYHPALNGVTLDSFGWIDFSKLWIKHEREDPPCRP